MDLQILPLGKYERITSMQNSIVILYAHFLNFHICTGHTGEKIMSNYVLVDDKE
jgi:hypothetical protein